MKNLISAIIVALFALCGEAYAACPAGNTGPCEPWSTGNNAATDITTLTDSAKFGLSAGAGTWRTTTGPEILTYLSGKAWTFSGAVNFTSTFSIGGTAQTFPTSGLLVGTTDTMTLTNKTLTAPTIAAGALSGTFTGAPTFSGNPTFSGVPVLSGLSSGTQVSCLGLNSGNSIVLATSACGSGGGGGSITVTDGTNSVSSVTSLTCADSVVSGTTPNATCTPTVGDPAAKTTNYSVLYSDMGNVINLGGSGSTLTLVAEATSPNIWQPGQSFSFVSTASGNWTLTNSSTLTLVGLNSTTTIYPGENGTLVANADGSHLDCVACVQPPSTTVLGSVLSSTAPSNEFANAISTAGVVGYAQPAFSNLSGSATSAQLPTATTSALGAVKVDGSTITISGGVISATTGGTGCTVSGGAGAVFNNGSSACITNTDMLFATGVLSLGLNTSELGAVKMFGGTSGNTTIEPSAAAGSSTVATLPANTGTIAELNLAQTFSAAQSFGEVHGTAYAPSLTSNNYTTAITDCGKTLLLPTGTTPTVTLANVNPSTGECTIKMVQMTSGTSLYTIQAASGGTLVSANSYTHTAKQYATIVLTLIVPSGSAATWALSGEGS